MCMHSVGQATLTNDIVEARMQVLLDHYGSPPGYLETLQPENLQATLEALIGKREDVMYHDGRQLVAVQAIA